MDDATTDIITAICSFQFHHVFLSYLFLYFKSVFKNIYFLINFLIIFHIVLIF
jgi:hypothetical protein